MKKILIASIDQGAGKTNIIVGLAKAAECSFGYMKPFGERVLYRKKRLLDYDSALVTNIFGLKDTPEDMSIGFDHSKLRYMYTEESLRQRVKEMEDAIGKDKDLLIIEGGKDLTYGASVNLDPINLAKMTGSRLIIVLGGDDDAILDSISFIQKYIQMKDVDFAGVIINKVKDIEDFKEAFMDKIAGSGVPVLGIIPFERDLTHVSVEAISEILFAKVLAGEEGLLNQAKEIFVGAQSAETAMKNPLFSKSSKLIITSGDRSDMILAALETDTAGIVLTNNILPSSNLINMAKMKKIPLLLVSLDTFRTAKQIDDMERLLTSNEKMKIELIERLVSENVDVKAILG
jgi:BioD-like phosphotransacetylase family protein